MNENEREQLSAFVDGELDDEQADGLVSQLLRDAQTRDNYSQYLKIGEVMRHPRGVVAGGLSAKVMAALGQEPPLPSPSYSDPRVVPIEGARVSNRASVAEPSEVVAIRQPPARRSGFAIAASVVMAGIIGFFLAKQLPDAAMDPRNGPESARVAVAGNQNSGTAASGVPATTVPTPLPAGITTGPSSPQSTENRFVPRRLEPWRGGWEEQDPSVQVRLRGYLVSHSEYSGRGMRGMHPYARVVAYAGTQQ